MDILDGGIDARAGFLALSEGWRAVLDMLDVLDMAEGRCVSLAQEPVPQASTVVRVEVWCAGPGSASCLLVQPPRVLDCALESLGLEGISGPKELEMRLRLSGEIRGGGSPAGRGMR